MAKHKVEGKHHKGGLKIEGGFKSTEHEKMHGGKKHGHKKGHKK